ncbi:MAG TPA: class I SAM-dependent methyltransferase [Gaiellaceae bacterium]|nr:class I SAM-dependent methyltransferase [Gaiellaceae bacterium]
MSVFRRSVGARKGGRLADLGQDFESGHLGYVQQLDSAGRAWLRTKPYGAPPNPELMRCLRTFAHVVQLLQLGLRAEVLDVGCGPGWLSELLARCGYSVTGIDISPDMVEIARERIAALGEVGEGIEARAEFHAMPVRELPWSSRFDAAVLYDTMHHFDNEVETLEVIARALVPGGQLFIHEGVLPPKGSAGEQSLIEEMERYGTLESPFDPGYLVEVVERAGFVDVRRFAEVDELVDLSSTGGRFRGLRRGRLQSEYNVVHARTPAPSAQPEAFAARLEARGSWRVDGEHLMREIEVTNAGSAYWPPARWYPFPHGSVTVGPYWPGPAGERAAELDRITLARALAPGEKTTIELRVPREAAAGRDAIAVDLVREGMFWFAQVGSTPLVVPLGS